MARVFVDGRALERAIAVRAAVEADEHEVELVESARHIEGLIGRASESALILTGDPGEARASDMRALFEAEIPRPPVLGLCEADDADARRRFARRFELDEALGVPVNPDEVRAVLQAQMHRCDVQRQTGIMGRAEALRDIIDRVRTIAPVASTALVTGESGTGKELVARALHRLSPRRGRAFIAVNCAALPESLLESELFGHEKGAFTGATSLRRGMFELADGGTLLLDEIAEMALPTQTRLLRVLESRRFMRVGGDREIRVNVRVGAATNRDLRRAVEDGRFRRDLYYRLNVLTVRVPALRERRRDIPVLIRRFIDEFSRQHDREFRGIAPEAVDILLNYDWPGNVRELRNLIESMVVLAPGAVIRPEDIPRDIRAGGGASLVPAIRAPESTLDAGALPNARQLEFVFRTLVDLKVDMDDLRRDFENYKSGTLWLPPELPAPVEASAPTPAAADEAGADDATTGEDEPQAGLAGMTMAEIERAAIIATLERTGGNRRQAAKLLGIGERTIGRKIRAYEIDP